MSKQWSLVLHVPTEDSLVVGPFGFLSLKNIYRSFYSTHEVQLAEVIWVLPAVYTFHFCVGGGMVGLENKSTNLQLIHKPRCLYCV